MKNKLCQNAKRQLHREYFFTYKAKKEKNN
jgi:hypothetical protein